MKGSTANAEGRQTEVLREAQGSSPTVFTALYVAAAVVDGK